jgi:hypothetical protein
MATTAQECIEQEPEDEMQSAINAELLGMIAQAKELGILPREHFTEIEFNLTENCQATSIEYWPNSLRANEDRVAVMIPECLHSKFMFPVTARALNKIVK